MLVKVRSGSYSHDGWVNSERELYRYSFKARKGVVSLKEKANLALLNQPEFGYPVVLYSEQKNNWVSKAYSAWLSVLTNMSFLAAKPNLMCLQVRLDKAL